MSGIRRAREHGDSLRVHLAFTKALLSGFPKPVH